MLCLLFVWFSDFRRGFKYEFYITHTPRDPADKFLINIRFFALRSPPDKWLPFFNVTFCDGASEIEGISELVGCLWLLAIGGGFHCPMERTFWNWNRQGKATLTATATAKEQHQHRHQEQHQQQPLPALLLPSLSPPTVSGCFIEFYVEKCADTSANTVHTHN